MQGTFALLPILHPVQFISDSKPDAHLGRFFFFRKYFIKRIFLDGREMAFTYTTPSISFLLLQYKDVFEISKFKLSVFLPTLVVL